ncbi:hypothetical protein [Actinocorallia populi]|uniref:hypothetical protein n=1 Tax=Actinocorallia populi TaxID=2079200 RepID=UPI000D08DE9C|nr:hypothetical protein [Actinocorallia populi]
MTEIERSDSGGGLVATAVAVAGDAVRYGVLLVQLAAAGMKLRGLSEQVRSTYRYVEGCSESVDRLADQMAALVVDVDTVAEHRDAAAVMRSVLEEAEAMATSLEDLSVLFEATAAAHRADYGSVAGAANGMPVPMADAQFYSNR